MTTKEFVRCCDVNEVDNIYLSEDADGYNFRYAGNHEVFEYCPWCGVLLDLNLPMTKGELRDDWSVSSIG